MSAWSRRTKFLYRLLQGIVLQDRVSFAVFFLTDLCNAKCPYCFNTRLGHFGTGHVPADRNGLLSLDEYEKIAARMKPLFQVVFGGGEPFLREEIDLIAEAFYRRAGVRLFSIPTNGSLVERVIQKLESMSARCPDATFNLQVSLDAFGPRHDELRVLPGGFEKARALCHRLLGSGRHENVNLVINTAVTEYNVNDAGSLQAFLESEFGPRPPFHHVQFDQRLDSRLYADAALRAKIGAIDRRSARLAASRGGLAQRLISRYYVRFINSLIGRQMLEDRMIYKCNAGRKLCVVMPDGEVSPCEPFVFDDRYQNFPKFNLRDHEYDVRKVQAAPAFEKMRVFIDEGRCAACPWTCAALASMTYTPRNWPLFLTTPPLEKTLERVGALKGGEVHDGRTV